MKTFAQIAAEIAPNIKEMMPWDAEEYLESHPETLIVDIRETHEYDTMHIPDSLHVPRGILENACEWDFEETEPELVSAREKPVLLVCRSGNRTTLAAYTLQFMGYENVTSLKTGLRGWSDYELPMGILKRNLLIWKMQINILLTKFSRNSIIRTVKIRSS